MSQCEESCPHEINLDENGIECLNCEPNTTCGAPCKRPAGHCGKGDHLCQRDHKFPCAPPIA